MWLQLTNASNEPMLFNFDRLETIWKTGIGTALRFPMTSEDDPPYVVKETLEKIAAMLDVQRAQRTIRKLEEALSDITVSEARDPVDTVARLRKIAREALK